MPVKANIFSSRPYAFLAEKIAAAPSEIDFRLGKICLLYTSDAADD